MVTVKGMVAGLVLALSLAGCVSGDMATRSAVSANDLTIATQGVQRTAAPTAVPLAAMFQIVDLRVSVPRSLEVSEANTFLPNADIVWRGDPLGDRYAQIETILMDAGQIVMGRGQGRPAVAELVVTRFHGVTEKTRYTVGGNHNMRFDLTLRDPDTGAVLFGPKKVVADVRAAGGAKAIEEDRIGRTQKVVVTERLREVIQRELGLRPMAEPLQVAMR